MDLGRRENETALAHQRRLIYGKLVDKTLADADYTELAEQIYGRQYSSDVARRMMYGSRLTLEAMEEDGSAFAAEPDADLTNRIRELQKERQRFFDQRREYNKLVNREARDEHIREILAGAAERLGQTIGSVYTRRVEDAETHAGTDHGKEAVLVFSDWHYGLKTANVFNQYNTDICVSRVRSVARGAAERIAANGCSVLHIVVLGDLLHGAIHTGVRVASEELVCDQLMQSAELLAQTVDYLSAYVSRVNVYVTYGNHGRTVQNKGDSIHRDNMERIIPWWLRERMKGNERVSVKEENETEFLVFDAAGHTFCATHGDNDSVKTAPRLLPALCRRHFGKEAEYILLGDKHHRESFEELGVTSLLCGSLCGTDDYANCRRLYSEPSQILLVVDPVIGVDAEYRLRCGY